MLLDGLISSFCSIQGSVTPDLLLDLPYIDYIVREALRLYSPAAR